MTELTATPAAPLTWKERARRVDPRYLIAFLITLVLVLAQLRYHIVGGYERLAVALLACTVTEALLSWFDRGKVVNLQSAYISGLSLTLLEKPQGAALWPIALGGWLASAVGWRAVFYINVPVGAIAIVLAWRVIAPDRGAQARERFDVVGAVLFTAGLVTLLIALNQGHVWGWASAPVLVLLVAYGFLHFLNQTI